jgi:4-amino-4-deoxy-L-arabinose transferase-like glycosyltransferase
VVAVTQENAKITHKFLWTASRRQSYPLLLLLGLLLFLPNLGSHGLWDVDEAHNAECAREMWEAREFVIPTFNYSLRTDKPVLLYWCLQASYSLFGVNEWSARFPSLVAGILNLILCYELGRRLFDAGTGLLAAAILGSSFMFCISCHAVTPDALLILTVQMTFFTWIKAYDQWQSSRQRQSFWLLLTGVCAGLAALAKGPVGVILPGTIILLFLAWQRDLAFLWHRRTLQAVSLLLLVAVPWYLAVGIETHWEFIQGFFLKHNLDRFSAPMEGHQGPVYFHLLTLLVAFAPWSIFLGPTCWHAASRSLIARERKPWAYRLLACWILVWLVVFSVAATKLPNYVLPLYPALALLTSRYLVRWWRQEIRFPAWVWRASLACYALVGLALAGGITAVTGWIALPQLSGRTIPEVAYLLPLALLPVLALLMAWRSWTRQRIGPGLLSMVAANLLFVAGLAAFGPVLVDEERAIRPLAEVLKQTAGNQDIRIGLHPRYYRPSLVFYTQREAIRCVTREQVVAVLQSPLLTFMLIPASEWKPLTEALQGRFSVLERQNDATLGQEVYLISNQVMHQVQR